jgi:hypothetical protein
VVGYESCRFYGLTGYRARPGLREALAACRGGDTPVVTKPDRQARSLPDAVAVISLLTARRAVEKGAARLRDWAPNSDHERILKVGSAFRWAFTVLCFVLGIGFIVFGIVK